MKIAFIGLNLFTYGGIQRVVCTLCNELCTKNEITVLMPPAKTNENIFGLDSRVRTENLYKLVPADLKLSTFARKAILKVNSKTAWMDSIKFSHILSMCLMDKKSEERLKEYINANQFDLVIGLEELYSFYLGRISDKITAKTIGWMHDTYNSYFGLKGKHSFGMENTILPELKKLDALIALTNYDKAIFHNKTTRPVYTLYNPVPFKKKLQSQAHDGKNLLFVGRIVNSHKGLDHLLQIVKQISNMRNDITLTIVGDGPDFNMVNQMIEEQGLKSIVRMVGKSSKVEQYYVTADAFLHTSNYEGFGVVIVEAMSYGVPVIAFENAGPNEIIHNGVDGFIIPKYDYDNYAQCVNSILSDNEKWNKVSRAAKRRAEDFCIENFADCAADIFGTVVNH